MTHLDPTNLTSPTLATTDFHADQLLDGRYRVISLIGQGGMGVVYKVEQIFLGKELALKTIVKEELSDASIVRRFQTEARAVFSVNHPNIIALHDFGLLEDKTPFMAMEFVQGKTLGEILHERQLSIDEAIPLFIQVCFGLAHAHEYGVVHRDVKPNNIMILDGMPWGTEGGVKILDFGIAKLTQHDGGEIQALTRTGEIFGSPFYMSPEQCMGGKIDHRSDIYSLGCVLFEALTGTPPFVGDSALNTMMMHQRTMTPSMKEASLGKDFPPALEQIVHSMLAKNPDDRYQNLGYAAHDLADLKRGGKPNNTSAVSVPRPAKASVISPNLVQLNKMHFYSILLATAAVCSILTSTAMVATHPITHAPALGEANQDQKESDEPDASIISLESQLKSKATRFFAPDATTDKQMEAFKDCDRVQLLDLQSSKVSDAGLKNLQKSNLIELSLRGDKNIKSVDEISKQIYLKKLDLSKTQITDADLEKIAKLPMLEDINLEDCNNITKEGLMALTASNSLDCVTLSGDKWDKNFISQLQTKIPQCTFHPYFRYSKLEDEVEEAHIKDKVKSMQHQLSFLSLQNPLYRAMSKRLFEIAVFVHKSGHPKEGWDLAKRAEKISEATNDQKQLSQVLQGEADAEFQKEHFKEEADINARALAMAIKVTMHDDATLLQKIIDAADHANRASLHKKIIEICKPGVEVAGQYPGNEKYLPQLYERIAFSYMALGHPLDGADYAQKNLKYWEFHQNDPPIQKFAKDGAPLPDYDIPKHFYARALIEMAHATADPEAAKQLIDQALKILDVDHPEEINLSEHYCDACNKMADYYMPQKKYKEARDYLNRGLLVLKKMKHDDSYHRLEMFEDKIAQCSNGAK